MSDSSSGGGVSVGCTKAGNGEASFKESVHHCCRWEVHPSPYGVPYYHNAITGESRWTLPTGPLDVIVLPGGAASEKKEQMETTQGVSECKTGQECGTNVDNCAESHKGKCDGDGTCGKRGKRQRSSSPSASTSDTSDAASSCSSRAAKSRRKELAALRDVNAALEGFKSLLSEKGVGRFDKFENWLPRLVEEPRFTAVPADMRKPLFIREANNIGARRSQASACARRSNRDAFAGLLAEARDRRLLFPESNTDGQFESKAGASVAEQALARVEASDLGNDQRWFAVAPMERARLVAAAVREEETKRTHEVMSARRSFKELLEERILVGDAVTGAAAPQLLPWVEVRRLLCNHPSFKAVGSAAICEQAYDEVAAQSARQQLKAKRKEKLEKDAMAERRKRSHRSQAESEFRRLLCLRVRVPLEVSWTEAKVLLDGCDVPAELDEASQEGIFSKVRQEEISQRSDAFVEALRQTSMEDVGPHMTFEEARSVASSRMCGLGGSSHGGESLLRCVPEAALRQVWEVWRRARLQDAAEAFQAFLRQSSHFFEATSDPRAHDGEGPTFELLLSKLSGDIRYKRLALVPRERRRHVIARLREVATNRIALGPRAKEDTDDNFDEDYNA
eukprot:TRINITY_DN31574_c0_g1_i1.p1 TRINITY_DN31574_c0_g1~~TRINITY_DN31574_c0_g1_i1.p1  ORF type:complete len:622 (+),score=111.32 TRINITY_DN31574_c0_g1_i1:119-1984(+)